MNKIGFACLLHKIDIRSNYSTILRNYSIDKSKFLIEKNLIGLRKILSWMNDTPLRLYRMSSDIIPFASHPISKDFDEIEFFKDELFSIGQEFARKGFRLSFHPGQYTILNSPKPDVYKKSLDEISYNIKFLDAMGLDNSHKVVIHIGGAYKDIELYTEKSKAIFAALPDDIKRRLVLENDDKIYNFERTVEICEYASIPPVFDIHHHLCNPSKTSIQSLVERSKRLWADVTPKVHISSQRPDAKRGSHDDYILDSDIDTLFSIMTHDFDIMVEAKHKQAAALKVAKYIESKK